MQEYVILPRENSLIDEGEDEDHFLRATESQCSYRFLELRLLRRSKIESDIPKSPVHTCISTQIDNCARCNVQEPMCLEIFQIRLEIPVTSHRVDYLVVSPQFTRV